MDELIRGRLHDALGDEPSPSGLRARVIASIPMNTRGPRLRWPRSFQPAGQWTAAAAAILLTIALIAGLLYSRGAFGPQQATPGTNHPASSARVVQPSGLAIAPDGTVYFVDFMSGYVFRIQRDGTLVPIAGRRAEADSNDGGAGDGGPALGAYLFWPADIAFDQNGNLLVADAGGNRVRRIDTHGKISTVAGSGPALLGVGTFAGDGGPATKARMFNPIALAFDRQGNLYISDSGNHKIRRVDGSGRISSLDLSSWSDSRSWTPTGMVFGVSGDLYVSDESGCQVVRITPGNVVTVVAGTGKCGFGGDGGPATAAQMDSPGGLTFDLAGNLYVADTINHRVRRIDGGGTITTVAGDGTNGVSGDGGPATNAQVMYPFDVEVQAGLLYITEASCHCTGADQTPGRIQVLRLSDGIIGTVASSKSPIANPGA